MSSSVRLIRRYVWLVDTIRRAGSLSLEEINRKWSNNTSLNSYGESGIPERTFHRHRQAIEELFGIEISCNRSGGNRYYIVNEEILEKATFQAWLFNGLSLDNQVIEHEDISGRIIFEDIPGGMEYMPEILDAMKGNKKLRIDYDSISHGYYADTLIEPYFVKQRLRRWYMIANVLHSEDKERIEVFALDRIDALKVTEDSFEYDPKIDPEQYFDEVIGILLDEEYDCERVVVRFYNNQVRYVELLPLHKSQKEVGRGKDYIDYEYTVRPEWEFIHEILRLGFEAEVLSPAWVREEIPWQAEEIIRRYNPADKCEKIETNPSHNTDLTLLFLDFDGVLNTDSHIYNLRKEDKPVNDEYGPVFDPCAAEALKLIIESIEDVRIIITSSWRYMYSLSDLKEMWQKRGLPGKIFGILPTDSLCETRGEEITEYLSGKWKGTNYVIIDDEDSYSESQKSHCYIVNSQYGLTKTIAKNIIGNLNI